VTTNKPVSSDNSNIKNKPVDVELADRFTAAAAAAAETAVSLDKDIVSS